MILSDKSILGEIEEGNILIEPFRPDCLGSNSYDVHLGRYLLIYKEEVLDVKKQNKTEEIIIPVDGYVLQPGKLYLGVTEEYTEAYKHVPFLEGKSSTGRLGLVIHASAGKGDVGFCNTWTLQISCIQPIRIYSGMPIGQLFYFALEGDINNPYFSRSGAKYLEKSIKPVESFMWKSEF
jgi:dCTP deaminase